MKQNFYDDGQLFEDMFNRSHFVTESDKTNLVFVCLVSMINNNIHWVNVQELQTFFFHSAISYIRFRSRDKKPCLIEISDLAETKQPNFGER